MNCLGKKVFLLFIAFALSLGLYAQREIVDFTKDWKFHLGHACNIEKDFGYGTGTALQFAKLEPAPYGSHGVPATLLKFEDSNWKEINLPHDWSIDQEYDFTQNALMGSRYGFKEIGSEYPETSIGWYRKVFNVKKYDEGKHITLDFNGVFRNCMVWVNGFYMGRHWSGYTGFNFDVSDYLIYGKENVISVRVDASLHEGWFYEGSGINKEVYLVKTSPIHINHTGPIITTVVKEGQARVKIVTEVSNEGFDNETIKVINEIKDHNGQLVDSQTTELFNIHQRSNGKIEQSLNISEADLWSTSHPYRYQLHTKVIKGGKSIDDYKTKFGVRTIKFDPDKGFIMNGKREQINGVCIHQNFAGVGSAIPEALHYYRLKLLKEMGVNAIRSHYPFSKSMLNACDSIGMLVMDETRASGSYAEALDQVKWMVTNHRNHPSIILWSMANEEGGTQRDIIGLRYMQKMVAEAHKYDSTRLVTAGVNAWGGKVDFGFSQAIDVMGFNYSTEFIDEYHKNHPTQPIIGSEVTNATVTRGFYEFSDNNKAVVVADGVGGYYMPEGEVQKQELKGHIASNIMATNMGAYNVLKFYAEREYLAGSFFWTGFDYNGETWPSKAPNNSSQFGAMDLCGFPKAMYYYYQAWWTNKPVLHMAQHWNWQGMEGKDVEVLIHSNCDEVKLVLNGKTIGKRSVPKFGYLNWKVKYAKGKLKAIGYKNGVKVMENKLETSSEAFQIKMLADKLKLKADGKDISVVRVEIIDKKGRSVALANNHIEFKVEGDACILGTGNGDPSSDEIDSKPQRNAFNGKAVVIIQAGNTKGTITLKAISNGLESGEIVLTEI